MDLISHLEEVCDDGDVVPHLDKSVPVSEWRQVSPQAIYDLAMTCLDKKRARPVINTVCDTLGQLFC